MQAPRRLAPARALRSGFSLIELLVVIVVLGIAGTTLTMVSTRSSEMSARMLREQQALALATALLNEVRQMPFTWCDPTDANAATATSAGGCATTPELMGPEPGETRLGALRYNNVNDYNGFSMTGAAMRDAANNLISATLPTVANCTVRVTVAPQAVAGVTAGDALRVAVRVDCPGQIAPVVVDAIRVRYAPNQLD